MADVPVVKIPPLNNTFGPIRLRYCPYIGDIINTTNSKTPNTNPYSVAVAPFFSACGKISAIIFHLIRVVLCKFRRLVFIAYSVGVLAR